MDKNDDNILGCFVFWAANYAGDDPLIKERREEKSKIFSAYIWGEFGGR